MEDVMSGTDKQTKAKVKWMNGQMDGWMEKRGQKWTDR